MLNKNNEEVEGENGEIDDAEYGRNIIDTEDIQDDYMKEPGEDPLNKDNNSDDEIINKLKDINKEIDNIINDIDEKMIKRQAKHFTQRMMMQTIAYQHMKRWIYQKGADNKMQAWDQN